MKYTLGIILAMFSLAVTACERQSLAEREAARLELVMAEHAVAKAEVELAQKLQERKRQRQMVRDNICPSRYELAIWTPQDVAQQTKAHGCSSWCPSQAEQHAIARDIRGGLKRLQENGCPITIRTTPIPDDPTVVVVPGNVGIPMGPDMSMLIF